MACRAKQLHHIDEIYVSLAGLLLADERKPLKVGENFVIKWWHQYNYNYTSPTMLSSAFCLVKAFLNEGTFQHPWQNVAQHQCQLSAWYNNSNLRMKKKIGSYLSDSNLVLNQSNQMIFSSFWLEHLFRSVSIIQDLKTYLFSALSETLTVLSLVPSNLAYCNFVEYGSSEKPTRKVLMLLLFEDATGNFLASSRKLSLAYT